MNCRITLRYAACLIGVLPGILTGQTPIVSRNDVQIYSPGEWLDDLEIPCACQGRAWPESSVFNEISCLFHLPICGYPMRHNLFTGLNDTAQFEIGFINRTDNDYSLIGKDPSKWFEARVFRNIESSRTGIPWRDSSQLGWRHRGWRSYGRYKISAPTKVGAHWDGALSMVIDVWNLPEGLWSLCIDTTSKVPSDFVGRMGGDNYEYREAADKADSVNAYEACFWRVLQDSNYVGAKKWLDSMLFANANSVPGLWLRGIYYTQYLPDTTKAIEAFDKALIALTDDLDPAMPDSSERLLFPAERHYLLWCRQQIEWERSQLGP